ncbi:MAG: class I SAM-dependent methyltransferase, partial [Propionibacterium acidifaciens]
MRRGPEPSSARPGGDAHDYWNHNAAHHRWVLDAVRQHGRCRVLDVGCGEELLLQRLAPLVASATGVERDEGSVERARARLSSTANTLLVHCSFEQFVPDEDGYDLIVFPAPHGPARRSDPRGAAAQT